MSTSPGTRGSRISCPGLNRATVLSEICFLIIYCSTGSLRGRKCENHLQGRHSFPIQRLTPIGRQPLNSAVLRSKSWDVAGVAQLVEHPPCKREVAGSSPAAGTKLGTLSELPGRYRPVGLLERVLGRYRLGQPA